MRLIVFFLTILTVAKREFPLALIVYVHVCLWHALAYKTFHYKGSDARFLFQSRINQNLKTNDV